MPNQTKQNVFLLRHEALLIPKALPKSASCHGEALNAHKQVAVASDWGLVTADHALSCGLTRRLRGTVVVAGRAVNSKVDRQALEPDLRIRSWFDAILWPAVFCKDDRRYHLQSFRLPQQGSAARTAWVA
jgi:hypothetical protein